jgi:hypothetical protein
MWWTDERCWLDVEVGMGCGGQMKGEYLPILFCVASIQIAGSVCIIPSRIIWYVLVRPFLSLVVAHFSDVTEGHVDEMPPHVEYAHHGAELSFCKSQRFRSSV